MALTKKNTIAIRDEKGELVDVFASTDAPKDEDIERCLKQCTDRGVVGASAFLDTIYTLED